MVKHSFLVAVLCLFMSDVYATQLVSGDFTFDLSGDWNIMTEESGALRAQNNTNGKFRSFIISIFQPESVEAGSKQLVFLQEYLENLGRKNKDLKKENGFILYKTSRGAPFNYITYSSNTNKGFFIGASLGSNSGNIFITYEGNGKSKDGVEELKLVMESMKYKGN